MTGQQKWPALASETLNPKNLPSLQMPDPACRRIRCLTGITPEAAFVSLADRAGLLWLDSAAGDDPRSQWSFLMADPCAVLKSHGPDSFVSHAGGVWRQQISPLAVLSHFSPLPDSSESKETIIEIEGKFYPAPPFMGGWAGLISYDYGRKQQNISMDQPDEINLPDLWMGAYDICLAWQHNGQQVPDQLFIISTGWSGSSQQDQQERAQNRLTEMMRRLSGVAEKPIPPLPKLPNVRADSWKEVVDPGQYRQNITKVKDYIANGDIFQANLAQCFEANLPFEWEPNEIYRRVRAVSPAPFGGYLHGDGWALASASPERFVSLTENGKMEARPIKGTAPRGKTAEEDQILAEQLLASVKDRAENVMILDLLRNDLAKIATPGSLCAEDICQLETYENVHHLVSSVTAQLAAGYKGADIWSACAPGGSITGAPKKRAMEIIAELEPYPRGAYCGNLGYISLSGAMDSNILIRTLFLADIDKASQFGVLWGGGGITALSDEEAEYQEILTKISSLRRALDLSEYLSEAIEKNIEEK